jgi:hypothetical protein
MLDPRRPDGWPLGEPSDELIEEFLCADLEMERVSAVFYAYIEELDSVRTPRIKGRLEPETDRCTHRQS